MIYIITDNDYSDYIVLGLLEGPKDFDFKKIQKFINNLIPLDPLITYKPNGEYIYDGHYAAWEDKREKILRKLYEIEEEDEYKIVQASYVPILVKEFSFKILEHKLINILKINKE